MKKLPRPSPSAFAFVLALLVAATRAAALVPTEWQNRQALNVPAPGLSKIALPAATFDSAQPNLADVRLIDAARQEVPYLLDREFAAAGFEPARMVAPKSFRVVPNGDTTQLVLETGTTDPLDAVELETSVPFFLKAAHLEISSDGTAWRSVDAATPVFRQFGAEQLRLSLGRERAAFVRVTLDDFRSRQITFTGAKLLPAPTRAAPPPLVPLGATISRRDEFAGETVLTVTLDGRHVPLAALTFAAKDPLFMRRVTVAVREVRETMSSERTIGSGTIYRVALDGAPTRAQLELPLEFQPLTRELLVHIHNGDSPPLAIEGVQAQQHPVNLLFFAPAAGAYTLLTGNPQVAPPRYDVAAFAGEMRGAGAAVVKVGDVETMPDYHPRESLATAPLPDVPLSGAPLDAKNWTAQRAIKIERPGVQELELDLETLAQARPDFADLRVLRGGNQIPYVLELTGLARSLALAPAAAPDAKHPSVSVWRLPLPQANLPVRRIVLTSSTPLFQRQFHLYEKLIDQNGAPMEITLASGAWSRTPEPGVPETRIFELAARPRTNVLFLETDNGDNPAIALSAVQAIYPVVRVVFKTADTEGFTLAYGNDAANAPRYDLSLVAAKLLTSSRAVAQIMAGQLAAATGKPFAGLKGGVVFWGALALVIIVLLVVVAKLLPKPPSPAA
jgi:hypothetical protein